MTRQPGPAGRQVQAFLKRDQRVTHPVITDRLGKHMTWGGCPHQTTPFRSVLPRQYFHPHIMTSTVIFPPHASDQLETMSSVSVLSRQATALEICDMVYGNKTPSWEAIEHYYEPSASEPSVLTLLL